MTEPKIKNTAREVLLPENEAAWLEMRLKDITSTLSPALFDLSPYCTKYELYHAKVSGLEIPFEVNDRMLKGSRMQDYAAAEVALKEGWKHRRMSEYIRLPELGIGSSFDYEVECPKRGLGILELKGVDHFQYKQKWTEDEIPAHIEVQVRHQQLVAGKYDWTVVAAWTGLYDYKLHYFDRDHDFEAAIVNASVKFWYDVANRIEPKPDFYRDGDVINRVFGKPGEEIEDRSGDKEIELLAAQYKRFAQEEASAKSEKEAAKAAIHFRLGNAGGAYTNGYFVKAGQTKGSKGTLVTPEMVGTYVGSRAGYRQCVITEMKMKEEK